MKDRDVTYTDRAERHFLEGKELFLCGKFYRAYRQFRIAQEYGFNEISIRFQIAKIDRCSGKLVRAKSGMLRLQEENTYDGELFLELGMVYSVLDCPVEAVNYFKQAFKKSTKRWIRTAALHKLIGLQYVGSEKIQKLVSIASSAEQAPLDSFLYRRTEALLQELNGESHEAFLSFRHIREYWPEYRLPLMDLARISIAMENYSLALSALKIYRKRNIQDPDAGRLYARIHFISGHHRTAASLLKSYSDSDIGDAKLFVNIAHSRILSGNYVAAIRAFRKAIALNPDLSSAHLGLAVLYHENGSLDTAEDCYRQALLCDPGNFRILYNLGNLLYESGDYNSSIRAFQHCLRINPDFDSATNNLKFVMMAKICYPEDGPESDTKKRISFYWIGAASIMAILLLSVFKGWF